MLEKLIAALEFAAKVHAKNKVDESPASDLERSLIAQENEIKASAVPLIEQLEEISNKGMAKQAEFWDAIASRHGFADNEDAIKNGVSFCYNHETNIVEKFQNEKPEENKFETKPSDLAPSQN